jgi:excisionase family DNA binding protein
MENRSLTVNEAADRLRLSIDTIYRRIDSGDIKAVKVFSQWRIPESEIERLLEPSMEAEVAGDKMDGTGTTD